MNKFILTLTVAAFAFIGSAQAGEKTKANSGCCASAQSTSIKSSCTAGQTACGAKAKEAKKGSPATARGAYLAMLAQR